MNEREKQIQRAMEAVQANGVRERVGQAGTHMGAVLGTRMFERLVEDASAGKMPLQSPIEAIFFSWWWMFEIEWCTYNLHDFHGPDMLLEPQAEALIDGATYRVDFQLVPHAKAAWAWDNRAKFPLLAIELDGHEFHEKTKEQVTYRNQRDRALQLAGWRVLHVSGSELWKTPAATTENIYVHCRELFMEFRKQCQQ